LTDQHFLQNYLDRFRDQHTVTIATGTTCAYLGDERNLREYLLADSIVQALRQEGHVVHYYWFDDDLDPLNYRQLRVAVNKQPEMVEKFEPNCGKPICDIRWPGNPKISWSQHFEKLFLERLKKLGCNPNLISVSRLYERGIYAPYVKQVLLQEPRIRAFVEENFPSYRPEKLFWAVCPTCGYIDCTQVGNATSDSVDIVCERCLCSTTVAYSELRGKLNWKLDCAARWSIFNISAEPFTKAYLEPHTGSFQVAQAIAKTFFGGKEVVPIQYGIVSMNKELGGKLLDCLPVNVVRELFLRQAKADLDITEERIATEANRSEVLPDMTYAELVKQLLPVWILDSSELDTEQRELLVKGIAYAKHFEHRQIRPYLPNRAHIEGIPVDILRLIQNVIHQVIVMRNALGDDYDAFREPAKAAIERLGAQRKEVTRNFRRIINQDQGVPNSRFLFLLPMSYLMNLESLIDFYVSSRSTTLDHAVVEVPAEHHPQLRIVAGDRLAMEH
jgi:hypothetical protein